MHTCVRWAQPLLDGIKTELWETKMPNSLGFLVLEMGRREETTSFDWAALL